jgi:hypothetical protein
VNRRQVIDEQGVGAQVGLGRAAFVAERTLEQPGALVLEPAPSHADARPVELAAYRLQQGTGVPELALGGFAISRRARGAGAGPIDGRQLVVRGGRLVHQVCGAEHARRHRDGVVRNATSRSRRGRLDADGAPLRRARTATRRLQGALGRAVRIRRVRLRRQRQRHAARFARSLGIRGRRVLRTRRAHRRRWR